MIKNFVPAPVPFDIEIAGQPRVLIGWTTTPDGLAPVAIDPTRPCVPTAIAGPVKYGWPNLPVTLAEASEVTIGGGDIEVYSARDGSPIRVLQAD